MADPRNLVEVEENEDLEIDTPEGSINEDIDVIEDESGNVLSGEPAPELPQEDFYAN